jgi:hypothetical protein
VKPRGLSQTGRTIDGGSRERAGSPSALASSAASVLPLVEDKLWALQLPYALTAPTSSHPPGTEGYCALDCYLLREGDEFLLVDTGFPAHREAVLTLLAELVAPSRKLKILLLRSREVGSLGNLNAIVARYDVTGVYSQLPWSNIRDLDVRTDAAREAERCPNREPRSVLLSPGGLRFPLGSGGRRQLEWFKPLIQLLVQSWLYDEETQTLFTAELFGHTSRPEPLGPWAISTTSEDETSEATLAAYLRGSNRFWWLAGADAGRLVAWLQGVFAAHVVERIAPGFGCVLRGRDVVDRQLQLLSEALLLLGAELPCASRNVL